MLPKKRVHLDLREVGLRWLGEVGTAPRNSEEPCSGERIF